MAIIIMFHSSVSSGGNVGCGDELEMNEDEESFF